MECRDYEKILNAMPETGVYVIREADRGVLYFNKRVQEASPEIRRDIPCHEVWAGSCQYCPLLDIGDRMENRAVSYSASYGGVVDITATRTLWEGTTPAFVLTIAPRMDNAGYTYRKILRVDLAGDRCIVLKSEPGGWQPEEGPLSAQLECFARSGAVHPEDIERFIIFTRSSQLRRTFQNGGQTLTLIYRRQAEAGWRWNLMEVIPDLHCLGDSQAAILCIKDVHDVLREGLEREGLEARSQELIRTLGKRNFNIYTIDLASGAADPIRSDGQMRQGLTPLALPWDTLMSTQIKDRLHSNYKEEFQRRFSLEGLRRAMEEGRQKSELLCQWRSGNDYRYISVTAYINRESGPGNHTVLALQDVDEHIRQELAHTQRDMQMAAILKSRYQMMNTVHLDSGLCDRVNLDENAGPQGVVSGDYSHYIELAAQYSVHPDDTEQFRAALSLAHLREKALAVEEYAEEVCRYRLRGECVRWIELHVIYTRQAGQAMVNILGQDITREKCQEDSRLQALEDRAYIISSLSSLFFSTYYIDLEHDSFRAVTQLSRVGDVLGGEVNCTAAMQIYANNFIYPADRDLYLRTMSIQNLREKLRWWQPCLAVEYRKLPDGPADGAAYNGWVRATAVLAQTNTNDLPKTVVYVAQDVTDNKRRDR